jgi:hypothetical protein
MGKSGSTTIEPPPLWPAANLPHLRCGHFRSWADAVEQFRTGYERNAKASGCQDQAEVAGIGLKIVDAPLDGADSDGICHQIRFQACLDHEQATDFPKHLHR